jgi:hypothetical protein
MSRVIDTRALQPPGVDDTPAVAQCKRLFDYSRPGSPLRLNSRLSSRIRARGGSPADPELHVHVTVEAWSTRILDDFMTVPRSRPG